MLNYPKCLNKASEWEQKSIFLKVPKKSGQMRLEFTSTDDFLIDDVSLSMTDANPSEEVSELSATPVPTGIILAWRSPDDPAYNKIQLNCSTSCRCPQTTGEGSLLQKVDADNGHTQTLFQTYDWSKKTDLFISAFALAQDATSVPGVEYLAVDSTKPTVAIDSIEQNNVGVNIQWTSLAKKSGVYASYYAVGTTSGAADVINWTEDNDCSVQLSNLMPGTRYYLSVKSQNIYGVWSDVVCSSFLTAGFDLAGILKRPDGDNVVVTGIVSAIFNGCYYIQSQTVPRGIKVVGSSASLSLGMQVTVEGVLTAENGERLIDSSPASMSVTTGK